MAKRTRCKSAVTGLLAQYHVATPGELPSLPRFQCELHTGQRVLPTAQIRRLERQLLPTLVPDADVQRLLWIPGIGKPEIQAWYRQRLRTKGAMIARALVAKELARIVHHVLAKRQDFNGLYKGATLSRTRRMQRPRTPSPAA